MSKDVEVTYNEFAKAGGEEGIKRAITQTCIRIHAEATSAQQPDTGALRNSIMFVTPWDGEEKFNKYGSGENAPGSAKISLKPGKLEGLVGSNMNYATYVEFGTRYMRAQPYLRPAGMAVRGATAQQIANKYGKQAMKDEFDNRKKRSL